jgi:major membrane immunogen (membrane-anchored lipoprotein)
MKTWYTIATPLATAAMVVVVGCGSDDSGLAQRYKVSGTVTYKGQPVEKGAITFEPINPAPPAGRHASGTIENGRYRLTTAVDGDGALPGEYKVIVIATNLDMSKLTKGGQRHQGDEADQAAMKNAKSLVPTKYSKSDSPLRAKVETHSMTFEFPLED